MKITEQTDKIGQIIKVGDMVAVPATKVFIYVGKVIRLTPKGARVAISHLREDNTRYEIEVQKTCGAIIKIDSEAAMFAKLTGKI